MSSLCLALPILYKIAAITLSILFADDDEMEEINEKYVMGVL